MVAGLVADELRPGTSAAAEYIASRLVRIGSTRGGGSIVTPRAFLRFPPTGDNCLDAYLAECLAVAQDMREMDGERPAGLPSGSHSEADRVGTVTTEHDHLGV